MKFDTLVGYKVECRYSRYLKWYVLGTWKGVLYNTVMKSDALFCIYFLVSFMADWQSSSGLLRVYKTLYISHHLKCSQRPECACSSSWRTQRFVFFKSTCKTSSPSVVQKDKLSNICIPSHMCPFGFCVDQLQDIFSIYLCIFFFFYKWSHKLKNCAGSEVML